MKLSEIKQSIGHWEATLGDNLPVVAILAVALLLAGLLFGGLLLEAYLNRKREREKAKAVERLHKHLESLPSAKS